MKKIILAALGLACVTMGMAQTKKEKAKPDWSKIDLSNRANDHFMFQYGYDGWAGTNDSTQPSGFSRHFNMYFMLDKPFKSNPHYSAGFGVGVGSSNMFFENTYINLKSLAVQLPFTDVSNTNHFDKYKLTTIYFDIPIELRYSQNPVTPDKGFKASMGLKFGYLLKAYTKGKNLVNAQGQSQFGKNYIQKEQEKHYVNTTRIAAIGRVGYGHFSVSGMYQFTNILKTNAGGPINPWSIGLTISGL